MEKFKELQNMQKVVCAKTKSSDYNEQINRFFILIVELIEYLLGVILAPSNVQNMIENVIENHVSKLPESIEKFLIPQPENKNIIENQVSKLPQPIEKLLLLNQEGELHEYELHGQNPDLWNEVDNLDISPDDSASCVAERKLSDTISNQLNELKNYIDEKVKISSDKLIQFQKDKASLRGKKTLKLTNVKK